MSRSLTVVGAVLAIAIASNAQVVINEVYYDAPGGDAGAVFVELYGPAGTDIGDWTVQAVEMAGGSAGLCNNESFTFPTGYTIPFNGFVVLADDDGTGTTSVANADFIVGDMDLENGGDGVLLCDDNGALIDSVNYGAISVTTFNCTCAIGLAVEGNPARDVFAPLSIERCPAGTDTGDNDTDFTPNQPTPGFGEARCGAIEWVSQGTPVVGGVPTLTVFNGDSLGIDVWMSASANQPYLILWSRSGPVNATVPVSIDVLTQIAANFTNIAPFVAWGGVLDANGRSIGTAALDFSPYAGVMWPAPISTWIGAVSLSDGVGLVGTGASVQIDVN